MYWLTVLLQICVILYVLTNNTKDESNYEAFFDVEKFGANERLFTFFVSGRFIELKYCVMDFYDELHKKYITLLPCEYPGSIIDGKCAMVCDQPISSTFNKFPPTTKYIVVSDVSNKDSAVYQPKGVKVFGNHLRSFTGFYIQLLMKDNNIEYTINGCYHENCSIYYQNIMHEEGRIAEFRCSYQRDFILEIDTFTYELVTQCSNYPTIYYKIHNKYTLMMNEIYQPQFYLSYNSADQSKLQLKFTNYFSSEICLFSVRDPENQITSDSLNDYESNCSKQYINSKCYAPCYNVTLNVPEPIHFVEVLIQTRFQNIKKKIHRNTLQFNEGFISKKLAVVENAESSEFFISDQAIHGFSLNTRLYDYIFSLGINRCNVTYYEVSKFKTEIKKAKCGDNKQVCSIFCHSKLQISDLVSGSLYIFVIKLKSTFHSINDFEEKIFIKTRGTSILHNNQVYPITNQRNISITLERITGMDNLYIKAVCYISNHQENLFRIATCGMNPCFNMIYEGFTITHLAPGNIYDIKIVPQTIYDTINVRSIETNIYEVTLNKEPVDGGYVVSARFSPKDDVDINPICFYDVYVRLNNKNKLIYSCHQPTGSTHQKLFEGEGIEPFLIDDTAENLIDFKAGFFKEILPCLKIPFCSKISIIDFYDPLSDYVVTVEGYSVSYPKGINLPKNHTIPIATTSDKAIHLKINRIYNKFIVTSELPLGIPDNTKCKWVLRILSSDGHKVFDRKCLGLIGSLCPFLQICKSFEIDNIGHFDYELTVYTETNQNINGLIIFRKGDKNHETPIVVTERNPLAKTFVESSYNHKSHSMVERSNDHSATPSISESRDDEPQSTTNERPKWKIPLIIVLVILIIAGVGITVYLVWYSKIKSYRQNVLSSMELK